MQSFTVIKSMVKDCQLDSLAHFTRINPQNVDCYRFWLYKVLNPSILIKYDDSQKKKKLLEKELLQTSCCLVKFSQTKQIGGNILHLVTNFSFQFEK